MNRRELFDKMLESAKMVFDRVEVGEGDFRGGICRVRDERCLILNRLSGIDWNLKILSTHLSQQPLDAYYLIPQVREAIERYSEV